MESPQAIPQGEGSRARTESTISNYSTRKTGLEQNSENRGKTVTAPNQGLLNKASVFIRQLSAARSS